MCACALLLSRVELILGRCAGGVLGESYTDISVNMHDLEFYRHTIQLSGSRKGEARVCLPPQRPKEGGEAKMGLLQLTEILPFLQRLPTIEHVCAREILCENPAVSKTLTCSNDNYLYVPAP